MKVMKFGGSSVGSADAMLKVKEIVSASDDQVVVVLSALGGITDKLLMTAQLAADGDPRYKAEMDIIRERHLTQLREVVRTQDVQRIEKEVSELLEELSNIYQGVFLIQDLSLKTTDTIVSYGERMSAAILSGVLDDAVLLDSREFIKTRFHYGKHMVDFNVTEKLITKAFDKKAKITIAPGFISSDADDGDVTNLGRGGSDYTASIIAATLDAKVLEIWTDVDGFMTADPRMVKSAYVIERLSYVEAIELSNFGAKVIYPPTIFPVYHKNIPIVVKNTFNPSAPGTYISRERVQDSKKAIKGISSVADTCLITVQGLGMVGVIGINSRIFNRLTQAEISVFFVSQAASENNISIGVKSKDADLAVSVLSDEFKLELSQGEINGVKKECGLATIAIVGENMKHTPGIAGKLFGTLGRNGISVVACAQGSSETNISFVVEERSLRKSMNVLHDSFFLSEYQTLNIFIAGAGLVGSHLIEQLRGQQDILLKDNSLQIKVVGITNSKKFVMDREGIDLANYKEELTKSENVSSPKIFKDEILSMNIFNSVFVDCTASEAVASVYKDLLDHSISVVTANKIAASSEYEVYESLKQAARKSGAKFLFETNVGAGLPIINTISDLRNSGDKILKIEAVVSGTLNFIFNEMSENVSFSRAIKLAQEAGYAEPDPRIDLSGKDVIRKLVILAREAGYPIEQSDVKKSLFLPEKYFNGDLETFWKTVPEMDADFEHRRKELQAKGLRWRFIATFDNGKGEVALREVGPSSPFYELAGSNNVISITTERYKEYPMQIKGYGAGAAVTAAGVFADIISIANIR